MTIDHVLFIGFGGPPRPEDVRPYLQIVTKGTGVPRERLEAVVRHYADTGGFSPYNAHAQRLFDAVRGKAAAEGVTLPMFLGMRNWHPFLADVIRDIHAQGLRQGLGIILAPHRSYSSFGKYVETIEEAKIEVDARDVRYEYPKPWHEDPGFIQAQADEVRKAMEPWSPTARRAAHMLFCAHSIPRTMIGRAQYEQEYRASSARVAEALKHERWSLCYQSRSGSPRDPWLEPDVLFVLRELRDRGVRRVAVAPIGFLFDHTEVLYDLDIEAREEAKRLGLEFARASTVMDHPRVVGLFTRMIRERLAAGSHPAGVSGKR